MNQVDDAILEFLAEVTQPDEKPVVFSPLDIWLNVVKYRELVDRQPNTVSLRLQKLESNGLVGLADHSGKHYYITDKGRRYLSGELDRSELLD